MLCGLGDVGHFVPAGDAAGVDVSRERFRGEVAGRKTW